MMLLEQMAFEADASIMEEHLDIITGSIVMEGVDIPTEFTKETQRVLEFLKKFMGEENAEKSRSVRKAETKIGSNKPHRRYASIGGLVDGQADKVFQKIKTLGYKESVNVDRLNKKSETHYYIKKIDGGYLNLIVTGSTAGNKKQEVYITSQFFEASKVGPDALKLFK